MAKQHRGGGVLGPAPRGRFALPDFRPGQTVLVFVWSGARMIGTGCHAGRRPAQQLFHPTKDILRKDFPFLIKIMTETQLHLTTLTQELLEMSVVTGSATALSKTCEEGVCRVRIPFTWRCLARGPRAHPRPQRKPAIRLAIGAAGVLSPRAGRAREGA